MSLLQCGLPGNLEAAIEHGLSLSRATAGFIADNEIRFLGILAACIPAKGLIVEIGSYKGKSTVMLGSVSARYGLGGLVAIDPHEGLSYLGPEVAEPFLSPTFEEFASNLRSAGLENKVEVHRDYSRNVAKNWNRPIRFLWIDGDHSYAGCKEDFDLFTPHLADGAVVAFHDALNGFEGPIRVFVEEILRSDRFGPSGFVHSIAWSQFRPSDGVKFKKDRLKLDRKCSKLIPFVLNNEQPRGFRKRLYKFFRSRVPRKLVAPEQWCASVTRN